MATVAAKSFFSNLYDEPGVLAKVGGELVFFGDNGEVTTVEPADVNFLVVLGETGIADTQALMDRLHGGAAAIATHRAQEVA
jgi:hypothetical protein